MSGWAGAGWNNNFLYGHYFKLSPEGIKKVEKEQIIIRRPPKKFRRSANKFNKRINYKKKKMSQKLRKSSLKTFHKLRHHDIANQRSCFTRLQRTSKKSQNGIYNSIRYYKTSDYEYQVGQKKYYTYYLLHGNEDGGKYHTFTWHDWHGNYHSYSGIFIFPQNGKILNIDPYGTKAKWAVRHVETYKSNGNYIRNSYNEIKPWLKKDFKEVWSGITGAAKE